MGPNWTSRDLPSYYLTYNARNRGRHQSQRNRMRETINSPLDVSPSASSKPRLGLRLAHVVRIGGDFRIGWRQTRRSWRRRGPKRIPRDCWREMVGRRCAPQDAEQRATSGADSQTSPVFLREYYPGPLSFCRLFIFSPFLPDSALAACAMLSFRIRSDATENDCPKGRREL